MERRNRRRSSWVFLLLLQIVVLTSQAPFSLSQNLPCHPDDLKALQAFQKGLESSGAINGSWSSQNSSSYSSPVDCCVWVGVTCNNSSSPSPSSTNNSSGRVAELNLQNRGLKGVIFSDSLEGLVHLRSLNLTNNSLRGVVPSGLFRLQQLQFLDLSRNDLSGSLPADPNLPSIQSFNISRNEFDGSLPIFTGSKDFTVLDVSFNKISGPIATTVSICDISTRIEVLHFSVNLFSGKFPAGFGNCTSLRELWFDENNISGTLPEDLLGLSSMRVLYLQGNRLSGELSPRFGDLSSLYELDLSLNGFSGLLPDVFGRLDKLYYFSAASNCFTGSLPASLSNLSALGVLNLRNNSLVGEISIDFTAMANLSSLDLGSNQFSGVIPHKLSSCVELKTLNLAKNKLSGEIPDSFKNLTSLSFLSLSNNSLTNVASALGVLQWCPNLTTLVLTMNFQGEMLPSDGIRGFENLKLLGIPNCGLLGSIPLWLARCTKLQLLDLSWNQLSGDIPSWLGDLESLFYLDLSNNSLAGEIPQSLTQMRSLVSHNAAQPGLGSPDFPVFSKRNQNASGLQYNQLNSFPPSLILSHNMLVGPIPPEFGNLKRLHVLDLSRNNLTGIIPEQLSDMASLESLDLSHNDLSGRIPSSLAKLTFLSRFSVAYNELVGPIPIGGQFSTFSESSFEGNMGLCGLRSAPCPNVHLSSGSRQRKNKGIIIGMAIGIGLGTAFILALMYLVVSRLHSRKVEDIQKEGTHPGEHVDLAAARLVLLFQNKENKELTIDDILKSTNNFDQANIIGCGGFGLVYKATLPDGRKVAIKRLSGDFGQMEREFQAEVEALSRAQHSNLVLLQGYCRIGSDRLLIYSYMENGSLDYWLHEKLDGRSALDWDKRLQIAQGAAKGLAYLHQSCQPHILHRDIKSSNILLDGNFEAHLADFGLARLILPYDTHVTTDLVGTLGYIPPEYGQSSVATFKGDVYSFGVVLLELLTGKRPVDMCKPRSCRDLISWVLQMKKENRESEVFDPFLCGNEHDEQQLQVLKIACLCLSESPKMRPLTQQIVPWLDNIASGDQVTKREQFHYGES